MRLHAGVLIWICWVYSSCLFPLPAAASNGDAGNFIRTPQSQIVGLANKDAILRCDFAYPGGRPVSHIIEWSKRGQDVPIFILYQGYPPHVGSGYAGRLALAAEGGEKASLLVRNVQREDEGWYECKVQLLNRPPETPKNGSWVYLVVHAPPKITVAPPAEIYVKQNDEVTFNCDATGTPKPKITWMKDGEAMQLTAKILLTDSALTLRSTGPADVGTYECVAKNSEGRSSRASKLIIASGAVILRPPENMTYLEGERANLHCKAEGKPNNLTFHWLFSDAPIEPSYYTELSSRVVVQTDGTLIINPTSKTDTGKYTCRVTNGIEETPQASAWLSIEYPARITYNPTLQYLPLNLSGMIRCFVEANPPVQFVQWTKDNRVLDIKALPAVTSLSNGSLFIEKVTMDHQGIYTCTPYNTHGTGGASIEMNILVEEPPAFAIIPKPFYQGEQKGTVTMLCAAKEIAGRPRPRLYWRRADSAPLPTDRTSTHAGSLTIFNLKKSDHGAYHCVLENDVATLMASSSLIIESTTPHAPTNLTVDPGPFSADIRWQPAYSGGFQQHYVIWYRQFGSSSRQWRTLRVRPDDATSFSVYNLSPGTMYEFQVLSRNQLGDGLFSDPIVVRTMDIDSYATVFPTDASGSTYVPSIVKPSGARPGSPQNVHIHPDTSGRGVRVVWEPPHNTSVPVMYYMLEYRKQGEQWGRSSDPIAEGRTWHHAKDIIPGSPYEFRVYAFTLTSFSEPSDIQSFTLKHEFSGNMSSTIAITAGIVGGVAFFVLSIVIILCCIRCFKRKQSKARYEANGHRSNSPVPLKRGKRSQELIDSKRGEYYAA
ncbi:protein turtle-like isoform X2 [Paramacrobiotus metropolitanus]|uniref:protein turtle-like isoform X2 n=1 Tax=Paramacrobiotus metropolitanus TaxID=2943436 RepID=UPI0024461B10|nr:protein turtle-like isoform X2 [Paramacrobiotus metropolitanus]